MKTREEIIGDARTILAEIEDIFRTAAYWNTHVRKPNEAPVNPDPDGRLRRLAENISHILAIESAMNAGKWAIAKTEREDV